MKNVLIYNIVEEKKRFEVSLAENKHKQMVNLREFSKNELKGIIKERKSRGIKK